MNKTMSPVGKVATGGNPKANVRQAPHTAGVGNERKVDMKGAGIQGGSVVGDSGLKSAVDDLYNQHPHGYMDHGPHHGTSEHLRHKPMKLAG